MTRKAKKPAEVLPTDVVIEKLQKLMDRLFAFIKFKNGYMNRTAALVARTTGYTAQLDADAREELFKQARKIVDAAVKKGDFSSVPADVVADLEVLLMSIEPIMTRIKELESEMAHLVTMLPIHAWQKQINGFGELGLAVVIGCVGDPGKYRSKHAFKKRVGISPFTKVDGDTYACSTWMRIKGLSKDEWADDDAVGYKGPSYSPRRRSAIYAYVQVPLFFAKSKNRYGDLYTRYKQTQAERNARGEFAGAAEKLAAAARRNDVAPNSENIAGRLTAGHIENRARRYMTQKLICDLWNAWRRATESSLTTANACTPAAMHLEAAE